MKRVPVSGRNFSKCQFCHMVLSGKYAVVHVDESDGTMLCAECAAWRGAPWSTRFLASHTTAAIVALLFVVYLFFVTATAKVNA